MPRLPLLATALTILALSVAPAGAVDVSGGAMAIPPNGNTGWSQATVSGLRRPSAVRVRLNNLSQQRLDDYDILLESPRGQRVLLMSDSGGLTATPQTITFDQSASLSVPNDSNPTSGSSYRPTNNDAGTDDIPFPGPGTSLRGTSLNAFAGDDPNGTWNLYIVDDTPASGTSGSLGSWTLILDIPPIPANDDFANAGVIADGALPLSVSGSTWSSSAESGEPAKGNGSAAAFTTWHAWTPATTTDVVITTTGFDTYLDVFTGPSLGALTRLAGDDDGGPGVGSAVIVAATAGTTYWIRVDGYDDETFGDYTLTISVPPVPDLMATDSLAAVLGSSLTHTVVGGFVTGWTVAGLPPGLAFANGEISGTPTQEGSFAVNITATNSSGSDSQVLTITVTADPVISSSLLVSTTVGVPFSYRITASNTPTSFSATPMPPGLILDPATGIISGTPTVVGQHDIDITATNVWNSDTETLELHVNPVGAPVFVATFTARGIIGKKFYAHLAASNQPTDWRKSGTLPPGLLFDVDLGTIHGTPTTAGEWLVMMEAENAQGTAYGDLRIVIEPASTAPATSSGQRPSCGFGSLALIGLLLAARRRRRA